MCRMCRRGWKKHSSTFERDYGKVRSPCAPAVYLKLVFWPFSFLPFRRINKLRAISYARTGAREGGSGGQGG
jgi:hypothetical protein